MTTLTIVHHSERFDRPLSRVRRDAKDFRETGQIVTRTEMSPFNRSDAVRAPGWSFAHGERPGEDETSIEWSNAALSLSGLPYAVPLTEMTFFRTSGAEAPIIHALVTPLADAKRPNKRLAIITQHMALDNTERRAEVWRDCTRGTKALVKRIRKDDPGIKIILSADFNKNYRQEKERATIERHLARPNGLTQAWEGFVPEHGGTHGPLGLIDGFLVDEGITVKRTWLLPDTDGSDHRPMAMRFSF